MPNPRHKRDDFNLDDRRNSRSRSRSNSNSVERRRRRSRSGSVERRRRRQRFGSSRSRSRSRSHSRRQQQSRRYRRDSRSRSNSRSHTRSSLRSRSRSNSPHRRQNHASTSSSRRRDHYADSKSRQSHGKEDHSTSTSRQRHVSENDMSNSLENLPLPKCEAATSSIGAYYNLDTDEPIDKERIHREIEEKLRQALAKEGKVYPPPKPEASHPVFANDGSFLEIFKKMQEAQKQQTTNPAAMIAPTPMSFSVPAASTSTAAYVTASATGRAAPPPPIVGRRRGGKILKTGLVAKPKAQAESNADPKDFWSLYLAEVNKYKNNSCESDGGTRPLVK